MINWLPVFLSGVVSLAPTSVPPVGRDVPVSIAPAGPTPAVRDAPTPATTGAPAAPGREPAARDASIPFGALLDDPLRRVRTTDPLVRQLLLRGVRRSATFAQLLTAVNATDVIVYIQRVNRLKPTVVGQLMIVPVPGSQRYLRIQVLDHLGPSETIALIGHELRHALEVAAEPDVRDQEGLSRLYERIGERGLGLHSFDTREAQNTGRLIQIELAG